MSDLINVPQWIIVYSTRHTSLLTGYDEPLLVISARTMKTATTSSRKGRQRRLTDEAFLAPHPGICPVNGDGVVVVNQQTCAAFWSPGQSAASRLMLARVRTFCRRICDGLHFDPFRTWAITFRLLSDLQSIIEFLFAIHCPPHHLRHLHTRL